MSRIIKDANANPEESLEARNLLVTQAREREDVKGRVLPPYFPRVLMAGDPASPAAEKIAIEELSQEVLDLISSGGLLPAASIVSEIGFGQVSNIGVSLDYARGDHTHGSPADPIPGHVAGADPHTQYQKESEKDAVSGYAGLDASAHIVEAEIPPEINDTNLHILENISLYPNSGSPQSANEIQYTRVWLSSGITITAGRTYIASGADGVRQIRFGIYDQTVPLSNTGTPNSRVAQSNATTVPNATTGYYDVSLAASYAVTTSGWYWIAFMADNAAMAFAISSVFRANYLQRREEAGAAITLPASSGALTNPQSSAIFAALIE